MVDAKTNDELREISRAQALAQGLPDTVMGRKEAMARRDRPAVGALDLVEEAQAARANLATRVKGEV